MWNQSLKGRRHAYKLLNAPTRTCQVTKELNSLIIKFLWGYNFKITFRIKEDSFTECWKHNI